MERYFIRHAKTIDRSNGLHQSNGSQILTEGIDFAIYQDLNPDRVFSSPITRAKQTAELLFGGYQVLDYIYEYLAPNVLAEKNKEEKRAFWKWAIEEFRRDPDWKYDGSESFNELKERAFKLLDFLKSQPEDTIAIVGHGLFFRHMLGVNALGEQYTPEVFLDLVSYIKWDNLEMKKIKV